MNDDPKFDQTLQRLERAFGGAVLAMPALYDPNILAFALQGLAAAHCVERAARAAPKRLEARLGLPFTRYVSRLRAMNQCTRGGAYNRAMKFTSESFADGGAIPAHARVLRARRREPRQARAEPQPAARLVATCRRARSRW